MTLARLVGTGEVHLGRVSVDHCYSGLVGVGVLGEELSSWAHERGITMEAPC